jgi:hypothetical protein
MSLKNIKLPGNVIVELYRQSLVEEGYKEEEVEKPVKKEEKKTAEAAPTPSLYKFLGSNKKNITVIVHFASEVFLPETELQFLTKMLGACKLNLADVAIVNEATGKIAIDQLKEQLYPKHLLLFGVEPTDIQLPINFPAFKEQPYAGTIYLYAPGLDTLSKETDEAKTAKRKLWDCLKKMFV